MAIDDERLLYLPVLQDSRYWGGGGHIFFVFWVFFCGRDLGFWGIPQEIAGNNTVYLPRMVVREPAPYKNV